MILYSLQSVAGIAVLALISGCSAVSVRGADNPKTPMANFTRPVQAGVRPKQLTSVVGISGSHATMEALVHSTINWHPTISEAAGRVKEAQENIIEAKAGYLPGVSGGVRSTYSKASDGSLSPKVEITAKQMLYDFGKVAGSVEAGKAGETLSRARLLASADQLARDTAMAVIEVQRNRRLREVSQREVESIGAIARLVDKRTLEGASTDSDQVQAASRLESARAAQLQYEAAYQREMSGLAILTGGEAVPSDDVPSWLPEACNVADPDWDSVSEMQVAEAQHQRAAALLKSSRSETLPTLALEARSSYDLKDRGGGKDDRVDYSVGLNVSTPLYQGGATAARVRAASFALESADAARDGARSTAAMQLRQARQQVSSLKQLQRSLNARTKISAKARDLNRMQYLDLGTRTLLNVLDAEKELHEAELLAVNAEHDLRRLYVTCLYYSGKSRERFGIGTSQRPGLSE